VIEQILLLLYGVFSIISGSGVEWVHIKLRKAGNPKHTHY